MNRDFKGIWIPREIWMMEDLSAQEKCLWAEIHSLFDREKGGCFASNEYLMEFIGVKERRLQEMISSLKEKGLIVQVSFNGRERVIKAVMPKEDFSPCGAEVHESAGQRCGKVHLSDAEKRTPLIYRDKSLDKSIDNTHPTLIETKTKTAKAVRVCVNFGSHVKMTEEEHADLCRVHGAAVISGIIEEMNDYCLSSRPKGYSSYPAAIRQWLRKRKGDTTFRSSKTTFGAYSKPEKEQAIADKIKDGMKKWEDD